MAMTMGECINCGAELPDAVLEAANLLYGPTVIRSDRLLKSVEQAVARHAGDDRITEETVGQWAILDVLGVESLAVLVQAFMHFGAFGECRGRL